MASRASLKLLRQARDHDALAQCKLGALYLCGGEGIAPNLEAAQMWLLRAAEQGEPEAARLLARHLHPDQVNDAQALLPYYEAAAEAGDVLAAFHAGWVWRARSEAAAFARARHFWSIAAAGGHAQAQLSLARLLETRQDAPSEAVDALLAQAAEGGEDAAQHTLAERAWQKQDVEALPVLRTLAAGGNTHWVYRLGMLLIKAGQIEEAAAWLGKSAQAGHALAQLEFGAMLAGFSPGPMKRQYKRAARLLESALAEGVAQAGVLLARLHDNPRFDGRNTARGLEALRQAAHMGGSEAADIHYALGLALLERLRRGTAKPRQAWLECARWLDQAARAGHEGAQHTLKEIAHPPPVYDEATRAYQAECVAVVEKQDAALAIRLALMAALGLSHQEAASFDPASADQGEFIVVDDARGGVRRLVQVHESALRSLLNQAQAVLAGHAIGHGATHASWHRKLTALTKQHGLDWARFLSGRAVG